MDTLKVQDSQTSFGRREAIDSETVDLIESVDLGTNGILLKIKDVAHELSQLARVSFPYLEDDRGLCAVVCHKVQKIGVGNDSLNAVYQFLLSVRPDSQGKGLGKRLMNEALAEAKKQLNGSGLLYAMVETDNERSQRLFKSLGYKELGSIRLHTFSRVFPALSPYVRLAGSAEREGIIADLRKRTAGHVLAELDDNVGRGGYYVLVDGNGKIRAGIQGESFNVGVTSMPGLSGWFALNVLPHIPLIGRMINPKHFEYIRFGNPWYNPGDHEALEIIMSHVLAITKRYIGLITWDSRDTDYESMVKKGRFGMLRGINDTSFYIMGMTVGVDAEVERKLSTMPFFLSPLDN